MRNISQNILEHILCSNKRWVLPALLIMFILVAFTFPFVPEITYSGRSESPDNLLLYTPGRLTWESTNDIDENGAAVLGIFEAAYPSVQANNGDNIVAPGTQGMGIVRLQNSVSGSVDYTAVLYRIRTDDDLPVETTLEGGNFTDTTEYSLPDSVSQDEVLRAVKGTLGGGEIQDFDICWSWESLEDDAWDEIDTLLGDKDVLDEVTVGLYLTVDDGNSYITPDIPKTGDENTMGMYMALLCISGLGLMFLLYERRRKKKCEY